MVKWTGADKQATISMTDGVLLRADIRVMKNEEGSNMTDSEIDALFRMPLLKPSILVSPPGALFKNGLCAAFPGGRFSQLRRGPETQNIWGVLYLQPVFEPDDVIEYFQKFGINVTPARLRITRSLAASKLKGPPVPVSFTVL